MPISEVTMFRGVCDEPECKVATSDDGDYWCWSDVGQVIEEAQGGDWYTAQESDGTQVLLCPDHTPHCACTGCEACKSYPEGSCKVRLRDDEFGKRCEDCYLETPEGKAA